MAVWPGYSVTSPPPPGTVPQIDAGEALVFWLARTRNDPRFPIPVTPAMAGLNSPYQTFYEFDEKRLVDADGSGLPSYHTKFAKDTYYLYVDARSYDNVTSDFTTASNGVFAELNTLPANLPNITHDQVARPYATDTGTPTNPTTFQILCAGQDGDFGNVDPIDGPATAVKGFPGGQNYSPGDRDNLTNFSEGRTLEDHIP
jgi:hypothetical protein